MNEIPPKHDTPPEPHSESSEKPPIRKSQEEFVDDMASPSVDKSEYERSGAEQTRRRTDSEDALPPDQR